MPQETSAYLLFDERTKQPTDRLDLHVLARAYDKAWQTTHGQLTTGTHKIPALSLRISFLPDTSPSDDPKLTGKEAP